MTVNSKIKELEHGRVRVVAELQDERHAQRRHMYSVKHPPPPSSILMCYRAHPSSYPVGNDAIYRVKSGQGMNLTTDVHAVRSPKVINEFKHTPPPYLFMALLLN